MIVHLWTICIRDIFLFVSVCWCDCGSITILPLLVPILRTFATVTILVCVLVNWPHCHDRDIMAGSTSLPTSWILGCYRGAQRCTEGLRFLLSQTWRGPRMKCSSLQQLKLRSRCARCRKVGHRARECPEGNRGKRNDERYDRCAGGPRTTQKRSSLWQGPRNGDLSWGHLDISENRKMGPCTRTARAKQANLGKFVNLCRLVRRLRVCRG